MTKVIVFVSSIDPQVLGGGEKWNINTAKGLKERGFEIHLVCRMGSRIADEFSKFTTHIFELEFGFDFYPLSILKLKKYFKRINADLVICNFNKDVSIAGKAAKKVGVKTVIFRNGFPLLQKKWKHKLILPYFDIILTNSNRIKDDYSKFNWNLNNKIIVIRNGFVKPSSVDQIEIQTDKTLIVGAGRLTHTKRFDRFISIIEQINKSLPVKGIIIGDGPERNSLDQLIKEKKIDITCVGEQKSILPYLKNASLFLHTSENEGMPNVLIEAMYMGVPVVASNAGNTAELIENSINGFCIESNQIADFTKRCNELLKDKKLNDAITENAKKLIERDYNFDQYIDQIIKLF